MLFLGSNSNNEKKNSSQYYFSPNSSQFGWKVFERKWGLSSTHFSQSHFLPMKKTQKQYKRKKKRERREDKKESKETKNYIGNGITECLRF